MFVRLRAIRIEQVRATLAGAGKSLHVADAALEHIVTEGYSLAFGARFLKRTIDETLKIPLSTRWHEGSHFEVDVCDGRLRIRTTPIVMSVDRALALGDIV
ncbi:MAG: hypothetical protein QM736_29000 [Vicinamibacterales bacterium]